MLRLGASFTPTYDGPVFAWLSAAFIRYKNYFYD